MMRIAPSPRPATSRGFTLVELLVVVLIIGLLTGIVAPRLMGHISRSEVTAAKAQIDALDKALQAFRIDMGRYPSESEGLAALVHPGAASDRWRGPYLSAQVPLDPWGQPYLYRHPGGQGRDYEIRSLGRDRAAGGAGDDADLAN
ncbi:MAG: type II secretion system major pseudopilin GspG [Burkholderiaceae bacterium]|nr:type II secretion system major pseudopilin GspG [Aquabacterium sp.]NUP87503.1 type II secretion system major pseudopilin GspG [Burkholderiaceae bacterium]